LPCRQILDYGVINKQSNLLRQGLNYDCKYIYGRGPMSSKMSVDLSPTNDLVFGISKNFFEENKRFRIFKIVFDMIVKIR
jgi:hypothetical protein